MNTSKKVIEVDKLTGKEFDRTTYAQQWIVKQGFKEENFGQGLRKQTKSVKVYKMTIEDYVAMKNEEHRNRRSAARSNNQTPQNMMVYEIREY